MNKKLLISIASLLATAAFALMPAAAQAAPHVYKNGSIGAEGKRVRYVGWGTVKAHNQTLGDVECHSAWNGYLENPTGGGPAIGKVQLFGGYECVDLACINLGEKGMPWKGNGLPWNAEAVVNGKKEFGEKIGFKSATKGIRPTGEGFVAMTVGCEGAGAEYFGELHPPISNGIAPGTAPSELRFGPESGELESEGGAFGTLQIEGGVKFEGYGAEELLEVKNP